MEPRTHALNSGYRAFLWYAGLLGAAALGYALLAPTGLLDRFESAGTPSTVELIVAGVFGAALIALPLMARPHARLRLDDEALSFLAFNPLPTTRRVPLDRIRRFGVERETNRGRHYHVLLLELDDTTRETVRVSMYRGWKELVDALGERLGRDADETREGFLGPRFEDS